jgi:hypothetical protein
VFHGAALILKMRKKIVPYCSLSLLPFLAQRTEAADNPNHVNDACQQTSEQREGIGVSDDRLCVQLVPDSAWRGKHGFVQSLAGVEHRGLRASDHRRL